jgi:hypothetical protein
MSDLLVEGENYSFTKVTKVIFEVIGEVVTLAG